jgi:hypothetical protein
LAQKSSEDLLVQQKYRDFFASPLHSILNDIKVKAKQVFLCAQKNWQAKKEINQKSG